jgi:hypothetical protein
MYFIEDQMIIGFTTIFSFFITNILILPIFQFVESAKVKKCLMLFCTIFVVGVCGGTQVYHHFVFVTFTYLSIKFCGKLVIQVKVKMKNS